MRFFGGLLFENKDLSWWCCVKFTNRWGMLMEISSEGDLRSWLRKEWPGTIEWVEPGRGASVGQADAFLCWKKMRLPCECKFWSRNSLGLITAVRPAQIRYHMMAAHAGRRTCLLAAWVEGGKTSVSVIAGHWCPMERYDKDAVDNAIVVGDGSKLLCVVEGEAFWKGGKDAAVLRLGSLRAAT